MAVRRARGAPEGRGTYVNVGDVVRRKRGGASEGVVVGIFETTEGEQILVRWSDAAIFPNPTRERAEGLEVVRPAKGKGGP
jgi:hypothetical protein